MRALECCDLETFARVQCEVTTLKAKSIGIVDMDEMEKEKKTDQVIDVYCICGVAGPGRSGDSFSE
jgi:hypothetical protein